MGVEGARFELAVGCPTAVVKFAVGTVTEGLAGAPEFRGVRTGRLVVPRYPAPRLHGGYTRRHFIGPRGDTWIVPGDRGHRARSHATSVSLKPGSAGKRVASTRTRLDGARQAVRRNRGLFGYDLVGYLIGFAFIGQVEGPQKGGGPATVIVASQGTQAS